MRVSIYRATFTVASKEIDEVEEDEGGPWQVMRTWVESACAESPRLQVARVENAAIPRGAIPALHPDVLSPDDDLNKLTRRVIGAAIQVHRTLGRGLLESLYQQCMRIELQRRGLAVEIGRRISIEYAGQRLPDALVIDLLVEGRVIVELKAVLALHPVHSAQVMTYLRLSGCPAGLLINFNAPTVKQGLVRFDHPDLYRPGKG